MTGSTEPLVFASSPDTLPSHTVVLLLAPSLALVHVLTRTRVHAPSRLLMQLGRYCIKKSHPTPRNTPLLTRRLA